MKLKLKDLIAKHPFIATTASAGAGYYGGPAGVDMLAKVAALLGLV